jgi:hypothetical protein
MKWDFVTYGPLELVEGSGKEAGSLILIKADAKSDPKFTFGADEAEKLWQSLLNSNMPVRDPYFVLFSDVVSESGFPRVAVEAAEINAKGYNVRYDAWQLKEYKPTNMGFHVKLKRPSLWVFCDGFNPSGGSQKAPRARLTFASAKEAPKAPTQAPTQAPRGNGPRRQG